MNNLRRETLNRDCIFRERQNLRGNVSRNKPQAAKQESVNCSSVDTTPGTSGQTTIHVTNRVDPIGARQIFVQ